MAVFGKFWNAQVTINGVDLSDHCKSVTINYSAAQNDGSTFGSETKKNDPGLKEWSMEFEFRQDYAAGSVDATLFPLVGAAAVTVAVRPTKGAISASNPEFSGSACLSSYNPAAGSHGADMICRASFACAGELTRDTQP